MRANAMTDTEFFAAATLAASDRCGIARIREWENSHGGRDAAMGWVARERRSRPDPDDVRMVALVIVDVACS